MCPQRLKHTVGSRGETNVAPTYLWNKYVGFTGLTTNKTPEGPDPLECVYGESDND